MNLDLIRKLEKEAHDKMWNADVNSEDFPNSFNVEFAKLIVEECVGVVDYVFWSDPHEVYEAMELIEKHFGIAESPTLVDTTSKETWNHDASQDNVNATDYEEE